MMDIPKYKWPLHIATHPFEGFEDLRWKKAGSMKIAWLIIALTFIVGVAQRTLTGFIYNTSYVKVFNVVPILISTIVLFLCWVFGNWAVGTFLDGEGTVKNIFIFSAYALVPKIIADIVIIILSNFLLHNEAMFINIIYYISLILTITLIFNAIRAVHQYTIPRTIAAIFLTLVAILIILFLIVLLITLFQQVYVFALTIYTELGYRFNV